MYIYDSRKKEKLELKEKNIDIYLCGPTVYNHAHIGHARSNIVFDLFIRALKLSGRDVRFARNITDIDDKIIKRSKEEKKTIKEVASFYQQSFEEDMLSLNVISPDVSPKATEYMKDMVELIEKLIKSDIAYEISNGDVYFDISKCDNYGDISSMSANKEENISRVISSSEKRNIEDFSLWKASLDEDTTFEIGSLKRGRPGWHTECAAMINKIFGSNSDYGVTIHLGGSDLIFPHHENEAAQYYKAYGKEIAKHWMHNGFLNIDGEKMSKSLGNSLFIKDKLKAFNGEALRFYLMSVHYRNVLNYNEKDVYMTKNRLDKLYRLKKRVEDTKFTEEFVKTDANIDFEKKLLLSMQDDMNISEALAHIEDFIKDANSLIDKKADKNSKLEILNNLDYIGDMFGVLKSDASSYFRNELDITALEYIESKLADRLEARKNKDYEKSDAIRDELNSLNIKIEDIKIGENIASNFYLDINILDFLEDETKSKAFININKPYKIDGLKAMQNLKNSV